MLRQLRWFLPPNVRAADSDTLRRALLTVAGCFVAAAIEATIGAMQLAWGVWQSALACGLGALATAALPFWVRRTGRWRVAGAVLCTAIWVPSLAVASLTSGALVAALYYLVFASAVAAITLGQRAGAALAAINTVAVGGVYALHVSGAAPWVAVDPEVALGTAMRGAFLFNAALAALVAGYEVLREAALRDNAANERRYRALADYGPDLIAELDTKGRVLHSSAGFGAIAQALTGRSAFDAVHRDDRPALSDALRLLETQPSVRVGPLRWLVSRDEARWFEASLTRYLAGSERRVLVVARDVSERIALETQLRQSQKMQAVGQLGSGLAHDFNNLLMVISGYSELIERRAGDDPELLAAASEIQQATERGASLTQRLIGLARPAVVSRRSLDLNAIVRENERMLRVLLGESVTLLLELGARELRVSADAGELEQILVNLVANARDALPSGGTVRIATGTRAGRALLIVHDNGGGIDAAMRERIFEPFFTTKKAAYGAGLGLYVVYSAVTNLGGEIEVISDLRTGTRVTILLPRAAAPARAEVPARSADRALRGSERILVVEDRPELRKLLRESLESAGYEVVVAADGVEALALTEHEPVDLAVSDVVMPRMGGVALVQALRARAPGLRALFVSGQPGDASAISATDPVMRKPFLTHDLQRAVREILDRE
jgi:PAS domain S-box-containing protein